MRDWMILAALAVSACTGGDSAPPDRGSSGTLSFDAGGTHFTGSVLASAAVRFNELDLRGTSAANQQIAIAIMAPAVGELDLGAPNPTTVEYVDMPSSWEASPDGGSGSIVITMFTTNRVTGTFSGMLVPQASTTGTELITNGVFDLTY